MARRAKNMTVTPSKTITAKKSRANGTSPAVVPAVMKWLTAKRVKSGKVDSATAETTMSTSTAAMCPRICFRNGRRRAHVLRLSARLFFLRYIVHPLS
jgi:hypothetical protein